MQSQQIVKATQNGAELLEKVIINNDLACLNSTEKLEHVRNVCNSLNLNPLTKPLQLLKFQGKEILYFTKDATEQLRKNNRVSITKMEKELMDGGLYIVTAYASTPDGRSDASTGVTSIAGLKGEALANSMLKAETKAKRRVTLSICGLGYIDESEAESIKGAQKIDLYQPPKNDVVNLIQVKALDDLRLDYANIQNIQELQQWFKDAKQSAKTKDEIEEIISLKDAKKMELQQIEDINNSLDEEDVNSQTGEVLR